MTVSADAPLPRKTVIAYALPAAAIALPTIPVFIHLPSLYGDTLGLGLAATGAALLAARIFDTVTDPIVGWLGDRFPLGRARRKHWIVLGALIAGPALLKLLSPSGPVDAFYLALWSVVLYAGWTLIAVPYMAWGAELSRDYDERSRITAWREAASLTGIVAAGAIAAVVARDGDVFAGPNAVAIAAIVLGLVFIPVMLAVVPDGNLVRRSRRGPRDGRTVFAGLVSLLRNGPFTRLLGAWFLNGIANGIPAALFFLFLDHGLGVGADERPLYVLAYFLAAVAAIPGWYRLSARLGKHRTWCWAMLVACASFLTVPFLASIPGDAGAAGFLVVCIVTGAGLGADLALPPSIQADVVDYDILRHGRERTATQFALWSMSTKLALALAVGTALPALEWLGFDPGRDGAADVTVLVGMYAVVPVAIKLAAVTLVWRFPLTSERHAIIRRRLAGRRREA